MTGEVSPPLFSGKDYKNAGHKLMTNALSKVQLDFDRIATISNEKWNHNSHYHSYLLKQIASSGSDALEIGCGTGIFSRLLAQRFRQVLALDLSPRMIEVAKERSKEYRNIDFQVADAMTYEFAPEQFDCVASIATLHHLPFELILSKMKNVLKPEGTLLILDLFQAEGLAYFSTAVLAIPVSIGLRLLKCGRLRESVEAQAAWAEHGRTDTYLTLSEVRQVSARVLPMARVKRHLLWRYSLVWQKR